MSKINYVGEKLMICGLLSSYNFRYPSMENLNVGIEFVYGALLKKRCFFNRFVHDLVPKDYDLLCICYFFDPASA
jgi:hypothetical protein